jgi:hypothetical protein
LYYNLQPIEGEKVNEEISALKHMQWPVPPSSRYVQELQGFILMRQDFGCSLCNIALVMCRNCRASSSWDKILDVHYAILTNNKRGYYYLCNNWIGTLLSCWLSLSGSCFAFSTHKWIQTMNLNNVLVMFKQLSKIAVEQNIITHLFCLVVCMFFKWQYLEFWCVTLITIWAGKIVKHPFCHDPSYGKGKQTKGKSKASIHWAHRFQVSSQLLQCNLVYHIWLQLCRNRYFPLKMNS